jgi:EAL and modified HD-GYP domain-containing signal transduction protein
MNAPEIFVGRQPVLDRAQKLIAFELLFRAGRTPSAGAIEDTHATANVIANSFSGLGLNRVLEGHRAFINFSTEMLMSDVVDVLPRDRVILEILETVEINVQVVERISELKQRGFSLALDDVVGARPELKALHGLIDVIKLDLKQISPDALPDLVAHFKTWPVRVLAEKIDDQRQVRQCMDLGIDMFQGYYFARPEVIAGKHLDASKAALLRLLTFVLSDASDHKIEEELKRHPHLCFNLMRIVNSVGCGTGNTVTSVRQCLVILGRRQFQRWVQLLLYASRNVDIAANPLLHTAAVRARLMELLAQKLGQADSGREDRAFMVGILSLLDVVLGMPMEEIVAELPLEAEVKRALTGRTGWEGKLLTVIETKEADNFNMLEEAVQELDGITLDELTAADWDAVAWADQLAGA